MEPVPESARLFDQLSHVDHGLEAIADMGERVQELVPSCVGLSLTLLTEGLTVTLVSSSSQIAGIDALQFLQDGPCERAVAVNEVQRWNRADALDQERWYLFARGESMFGIGSTLSLPIRDDGVSACVNLYAVEADAFDAHVERLAELCGASSADAVRNADLSFSTRLKAAVAPVQLAEQEELDLAIGWLSGHLRCDPETAERRLREAAARAEVTVPHLARIVRESSMR